MIRGAAASVLALAGAHKLFTGLLAAGLVLRIVTFFAYRPALVYYDSTRYLDTMRDLAPGQVRPAGYPIFLWILPTGWELAVVPAVQHGLGLAIAVALYAVLIRLGVRRSWSAIATAPVLLDAYQLNIQQYILTEALFETLLVAGCVLILWRRPPGPAAAALAGFAIAGAALVRGNALVAIAPLFLALLLLRPPWRSVAALVVAFAVPLAAYAAWYQSEHGDYALSGYGGRFLYARVAPFADCNRFEVPAEERVLCPAGEPGERPNVETFMWSRSRSPVYRVEPERRVELAGSFARRTIRHQPFDYAEAVLSDFVYGFSPVKGQREGDLPVERWRFQTYFPMFREPDTSEILRADGYERGQVARPLARFLRTYQRVGHTPGPLLALALLLGAAAAVGIGRARGSGVRTAAFAFTGVALAIAISSVAVSQFSWRYQLPLLVLAPPAGAIGATALARRYPAPRAQSSADIAAP